MPKNTKPPPKKPEKYIVLGRSVHTLLYKSGSTRITKKHSTHKTREEAQAVALALNALSK